MYVADYLCGAMIFALSSLHVCASLADFGLYICVPKVIHEVQSTTII